MQSEIEGYWTLLNQIKKQQEKD